MQGAPRDGLAARHEPGLAAVAQGHAFVAGIAAFLLGHVAYGLAFVVVGGIATSASIVAALVPVTGGRIIAGGDFDAMGNIPRGGLVRMLSDGSVDTSFDAALSNAPAQ